MRRLSRFFALSLANKLLLGRCIWRLGLIRAGLKLRGYRRLSRSLKARLPHSHRPETASSIIWGVRAAARILPGTACLAQAVTLHYLLARAGYESVVRVGVAKDSRLSFDAHAWVVHNGRVVIGEVGATQDRYTPLTDLQLTSP